ncbi:MAG: antitoxin VapB family protein [Candidatus Thermoplasmatota archaeon]
MLEGQWMCDFTDPVVSVKATGRMDRLMNLASVYGVYMTKMVQLSEDAYVRLRSVKKSDESFSDTVIRLVRGQARRVPLQGLKSMRTDAERDAHLRWIKEVDALDKPKRLPRK